MIVSSVPIVVYPVVPVLVRHGPAATTLSSPNLAMLYNPQQVFERELRDPRGDHCLVIELTPTVSEELLGSRRFTSTHAPVRPRTYLRRHVLARHLRREQVDSLLVEELALDVLRATVTTAVSGDRRGRTRRAHRELAESLKDALWHRVGENVGVGELARRLAVSPFHLMRVFREQTGFAIHDYRLQLRLRIALDRLADGQAPSSLAAELGFASHSHFTRAFRQSFGITPSQVSAQDCASLVPDCGLASPA